MKFVGIEYRQPNSFRSRRGDQIKPLRQCLLKSHSKGQETTQARNVPVPVNIRSSWPTAGREPFLKAGRKISPFRFVRVLLPLPAAPTLAPRAMQRRQQHCLDKPLCAVLRSIAAKKGFVAGPLAPDRPLGENLISPRNYV